ncbi:cell envelope integrity protein TolA [Kushneria aurantia]|uniref:cell envelope integrity protein TolA n=1 Tax=Kushneria aurantia TaxID=504092 RepID=UPI000378FAD3|nr:cell envelope integrity protein TolA [Kushneria aurantia]
MAGPYRRTGYTLPILLAVGLHLAILIAGVVRWPQGEVTDTSNAVVQAELISLETATDQAQQARESRPQAQQGPEREQPEPAPAPEPPDNVAQEQAEAEAQQQARAREEAARQAQEAAERRAEEARQLAEQQQEAARQRQIEEAQRQAEAEAQRQAEAEAQRKAEAEAQRQAEAEAQRKAEAEAQRQAEAEAQRQAEAEAQRKAEAEAKRKAEAEAKRKAEAEAKRKAEAEAQRKAAQAAAAASRDALGDEITNEAESIANARQAEQAANGFMNLVRRAVEQNWTRPPNAGQGLVTTVRVQLLPTGELVNATVTGSSGDTAFDRSAIQAVERAAPFTEMSELPAAARQQFRSFNLRFNPEDVR